MTQTDDRILELLEESGLALSPATVAVNLDYSRNWVSRRMNRLDDAGLIQPLKGSYYQITDLGSAYLDGELTTEELNNLE